MQFFESFSSKYLEGTDFLYTFAFAFEKQATWQVTESNKRKSSLKRFT